MAFPFLLIPAMLRRAAGRQQAKAEAAAGHYGTYGGYGADPAQKALSATLALGIAGGVGIMLATALVMPDVARRVWKDPRIWNIPADPKPPVEREKLPQPPIDQQQIDRPERRVEIRPVDEKSTLPPLGEGDGGGGIGVGLDPGTIPKVEPEIVIPEPVFHSARRDPRFADDFQPPYPASAIREERSGRCQVEVTISASGRVTSVADHGCADADFYNVTRRQALSRWRFRPATRDGAPVESTQILTVNFQLENALSDR